MGNAGRLARTDRRRWPPTETLQGNFSGSELIAGSREDVFVARRPWAPRRDFGSPNAGFDVMAERDPGAAAQTVSMGFDVQLSSASMIVKMTGRDLVANPRRGVDVDLAGIRMVKVAPTVRSRPGEPTTGDGATQDGRPGKVRRHGRAGLGHSISVDDGTVRADMGV